MEEAESVTLGCSSCESWQHEGGLTPNGAEGLANCKRHGRA